MFDEISLSEIAYIVKSHGVDGKVKVKLIKQYDFNKKQSEPVFIQIKGLPVPFFIESADKSGNSFIVKFKFTDSIDKAEDLENCRIFTVESELSDSDVVDIEDKIIGFTVHSDKHGYIGIVKGLNHIPGNPVLEIQNNNIEIFVPFIDEFIKEIDEKKKNMKISPPDGLIELYL